MGALALRRIACGYTTESLRQAIGAKRRQQVEAWEQGRVLPYAKTLRKLAEALGWTEQQVLDAIPSSEQLRGARSASRSRVEVHRVEGEPGSLSWVLNQLAELRAAGERMEYVERNWR